jgi:competence protein ComGC
MKLFSNKLTSSKGETLIETLVAVLIVSLASLVFVAMFLMSKTMNETALSADQTFYTELSAAEKHTNTTAASVTVRWTDGAAYYQTFNVDRTGSSGQLMSYILTGGG